MKKILLPTLMWLCIVGMILLRMVWPLEIILKTPLNFLGTVPLVLGAAVVIAAWSRFKALRTNINTFADPGTFVQEGLYRYTRNPMYLGFALILSGCWLLLGALSPLLGVLLFVIVTDRGYIPFEEKKMRAKFGTEFDRYKRRTRRWI